MVIIYHNPRCSKSRQALEFLKQKNIKPEVILYLKDGLEIQEIKNILQLTNLSPRQIIRNSEAEYKENNLDDEISDDKLIKIITQIPKLLQRPIVINNQKAIIARPAEKILEIL